MGEYAHISKGVPAIVYFRNIELKCSRIEKHLDLDVCDSLDLDRYFYGVQLNSSRQLHGGIFAKMEDPESEIVP